MAFEPNLHARPYASHIDQGYNDEGEVYDIEVLSNQTLFDWEAHLNAQEIDPWSDEGITLFRAFLNQNNIHYYGAPGDQFSERDALDGAARTCSRFLLMEGLS